jgi:hypothetical protein
MTKLISREPKHFWTLLTKKLKADEAIYLYSAGLRGLAAETTDNTDKPERTIAEERIAKSSLVLLVKIIAALREGRPVKLVPTPKTWTVCFGPLPSELKKAE